MEGEDGRFEHTLDLGFHIINRVGGFYLKSDGLAREGLYEDLHDGLWGWIASQVLCLDKM